jgi:hypothetical protein
MLKSNSLSSPHGAIEWRFELDLTDHGVCRCASVRHDLARTRREQIGVIVAYSAAGAITRLAAPRSREFQRHNPGRDEAGHVEPHGGDPRSNSVGRDPAGPSLRQR